MCKEKNVFKFLVLWDKFINHLTMFWIIIKKHLNYFKSLALDIVIIHMKIPLENDAQK